VTVYVNLAINLCAFDCIELINFFAELLCVVDQIVGIDCNPIGLLGALVLQRPRHAARVENRNPTSFFSAIPLVVNKS
jgi:hypothetical protein